MLHMNPREAGITFTHDTVADLMPRAHCYEHIDTHTHTHTHTHNRAGMLHKRTRVKPRFLRAWYANPRSWNVEVLADYTSDSHMPAISPKSSSQMRSKWLTNSHWKLNRKEEKKRREKERKRVLICIKKRENI